MRHLFACALLGLLAAPLTATAEEPDPAAAVAQAPRSSPDFLFGAPRGSVSIRWSWDIHHARSDWFDFVRQQLTLERGDFVTRGIAGDVNVAVTPRLDVVGSAEYTRRESFSEYRDLVDNNRQPITQTTRLRQATFTGGVRYLLTDRGRSVSSLAFLPRRLVPYAGGGGGVLYYSLLQFGDFVDVADFDVFADRFPSKSWTPVVYVNGGLDYRFAQRWGATLDVRNQWASADLDERVFTGFEPLDLSGVRVSAGLHVLF